MMHMFLMIVKASGLASLAKKGLHPPLLHLTLTSHVAIVSPPNQINEICHPDGGNRPDGGEKKKKLEKKKK